VLTAAHGYKTGHTSCCSCCNILCLGFAYTHTHKACFSSCCLLHVCVCL
jgi:hypothetical protein